MSACWDLLQAKTRRRHGSATRDLKPMDVRFLGSPNDEDVVDEQSSDVSGDLDEPKNEADELDASSLSPLVPFV